MCAASRNKAFERRLKALNREARDVRSDMRVLRRALDNPDRLAVSSRPKSLERMKRIISPPRRSDPVARDEESLLVEPPPPEAAADDLFAWRPPRAQREESAGAPETAAPRTARPRKAPGADRLLEDARFANYFSSGSFAGPRPPPGERHVQRNKAIFMLVMVVVVGFILYRFFF